jgi:hypothetical protein
VFAGGSVDVAATSSTGVFVDTVVGTGVSLGLAISVLGSWVDPDGVEVVWHAVNRLIVSSDKSVMKRKGFVFIS